MFMEPVTATLHQQSLPSETAGRRPPTAPECSFGTWIALSNSIQGREPTRMGIWECKEWSVGIIRMEQKERHVMTTACANPKGAPVLCLVAQSCLTLCHPKDCSSWGFSRQEHWSRLPCPPPIDLPNPGIEPRSPTRKVDSLPSDYRGSPREHLTYLYSHGFHTSPHLSWVSVA